MKFQSTRLCQDDVLPFILFIHQVTSQGILSDAEVLSTLHLAPARISYLIGIVSYGVEIVSMVCQAFSTGCDLERLADDFFGVLRDVSVGYVIVVPRTLAKGVRV